MISTYLKKISIINYKNLIDKEYNLDPKINCFVGNNGVGKTNILDSIYHLALGKSYFNLRNDQLVNRNQDFMVIDGLFELNNKKENIVCSIKRGDKKVLKRNGKPYKKFSNHIGLIPIVLISPYDNDLINEGSSERRKFIDSIISQNSKEFPSVQLSVKNPISSKLLVFLMVLQVFSNIGIFMLLLNVLE